MYHPVTIQDGVQETLSIIECGWGSNCKRLAGYRGTTDRQNTVTVLTRKCNDDRPLLGTQLGWQEKKDRRPEGRKAFWSLTAGSNHTNLPKMSGIGIEAH